MAILYRLIDIVTTRANLLKCKVELYRPSGASLSNTSLNYAEIRGGAVRCNLRAVVRENSRS